MPGIVNFLKTTTIGGLLFLLPIGIMLLALAEVFELAEAVADQAKAVLFPDAETVVLPLMIATLLLIAVAFVAGLVARTSLGTGFLQGLEKRLASHLPFYPVIRQMLGDMVGGAERLAGAGDVVVVRVRLDDRTQFGFRLGRLADGQTAVFLPAAPSAFTGSVVLVASDRITETALKPGEVVDGMRRLGAGLLELEQRASNDPRDG